MDLQIAALRMDKNFFNALLAGDVSLLSRLLSDDFVLIDVMSGAENTKQAMLDGIGSREVRFESIRPSCVRVRSYERTAVVTRRTHMTISIGDSQFETKSRYTHVFVEQAGVLKFVSAQGTPIAGE